MILMRKYRFLLIMLGLVAHASVDARRQRPKKQSKTVQQDTSNGYVVTTEIDPGATMRISIDDATTQTDTKDTATPELEEIQTLKEAEEQREYTPPPIAFRPETATDDEHIDVNFDQADLQNILTWVSNLFNVSFLTDDALNPVPQRGGKTYTVTDKKITFKTHKPLTKREVWDLFLTFLDLWGLTAQQSSQPTIYQIVPTDQAAPNSVTKANIPAYIGTPWEDLPNNDTYIRYVYFVKNAALSSLQALLTDIRSNTARLQAFTDVNALIISDSAANIRSLMQIVAELDSLAMPEELTVIKLKNADADDVAALYETLVGSGEPKTPASILFGGKRIPKKMYFSSDTKVIAEPRTNSLIILGARNSVQKVVDFVTEYVDTELKQPYSPLYVYELQYASAKDVADILTKVTAFASGSNAATFGGVRAGDKYFAAMQFEADEEGNRLLIKAEKEDYLRVRDLVKELDVKQPQVAIEVLIVDVMAEDNRELGIQMRNKRPDDQVKNADFQNSGLPLSGGIAARPVVDTTTGSIASNLIGLAQGQSVGSLLISLGSAATGGVWAMLKILQTYTRTEIISNPFLVATNNYQSTISIGETRRIQNSIVVSGGPQETSFEDLDANLSVQVTPLINNDGIINLTIRFELTSFLNAVSDDPSVNGERFSHLITTNANVANGEVLAFGGLLRSQENEQFSKAPVIGDIPLVGWFFKNKTKLKTKDNILIFISPRVIEPQPAGGLGTYSGDKLDLARDMFDQYHPEVEHRDPIHRWFFRDHAHEQEGLVEDFIDRKTFEAQEEKKILNKAKEGSMSLRERKPRRSKSTLTAAVSDHSHHEYPGNNA